MYRRQFLHATAALATGTLFADAASAATSTAMTFGFGTYGMPGIKTEDAIDALAKIGFDSVEIVVRSGSDADPAKLSADRIKSIKQHLDDTGLQLTAFMEHLIPTDSKTTRSKHLDRLNRIAELGLSLSPDRRPVVQTVLGGGNWDAKKSMLVDRVGSWAEVGEAVGMTIAIKPHRGGAMSQPKEAAWLIDQLGKPKSLGMVYDYSHYAFRNLPLEQTIADALPYTVHVAIKDAAKNGNKITFDLPGSAGTIDFATIIKQFHKGGYRGDICCEVSSHVSRRQGYDPIAAAKTCYTNVSPAFKQAGVLRR